MIQTYSDSELVAVDWLQEQGWFLEVLSPGASIADYRVRIRGVVRAWLETMRHATRPPGVVRGDWFDWVFHQGPVRRAWVRAGWTEDLFRELESGVELLWSTLDYWQHYTWVRYLPRGEEP